ncbi:hypothetical protein FNV58_00130 (plasmid) [Streptomyces sp. RLB1-9]|nr:hypothetical protein FNV58_00130 [Streptomyces sp. RLB1-9]
MSSISTHHRFRDPRSTKYDFLTSVLVRCPGCGKVAHIGTAPDPSRPRIPAVAAAARRRVPVSHPGAVQPLGTTRPTYPRQMRQLPGIGGVRRPTSQAGAALSLG